MKFLILSILTFMSLPLQSQNIELLYVGDPMCSWCYGISSELQGVLDHYGDKISMTTVVGGLRNGGGDQWNDEFKSFLRHHWEEIGKRTDAKFKFDLLESDHFDYNTEPACRAVVAIQELASEKDWEFFKSIQEHFYYKNMDPKELDFYKDICASIGVSFEKFAELWNSDLIKEKTLQQFAYAQKIGATGFPSLYLHSDGQLIKITAGFATTEQLIHIIESR